MCIEKRTGIIDNMRKRANELIGDALQRIVATKPLGYMSDLGELLSHLPVSKTARTMLGRTYVYKTPKAPSPDYTKEINTLGEKADKIFAGSAEYLWCIINEDRTIGGKGYMERGKRLLTQGLLSSDEIDFLNKLETFWITYPEAKTGVVKADGIIEPWYGSAKNSIRV